MVILITDGVGKGDLGMVTISGYCARLTAVIMEPCSP